MTSSPVLGFKFTQDYRNLQSTRKSSSDINTTQSLAVVSTAIVYCDQLQVLYHSQPMVASSIRRGDRPVSTPVHLPGPVLGRATSMIPAAAPSVLPPATSRNYHTWVCGYHGQLDQTSQHDMSAQLRTCSTVTIATSSSTVTIATSSTISYSI